MEVYEVVKSIGSGSFGQVYLVKHKREDKLYVVKKIKTRDMQTKDREATEQEVRLLQKLRHTNIVAYKDSYLDQDQFLNIVMVYCEGGDMYNKIRNCKGKNFPETQVLDWFAQMALALYYLHDKKILHRDLKTQNIFLKHGRVRLGDFGIAKVLDSTRDFANTCIGTPYYMSPELFKYKPYSYKSDVWALGCVMYEICNLRHAFDAQSFQGLAVKIIKGSYPPITPTYSKQLRDLIGKMLSLNPKDRPTIVDVLNKPIIKRRVVNYMTEIFTGKYPEASLPNDVDDIYIDSLREQAEGLGIMHYIQENIAKGDTPEKMFDMGEENAKEPVDKKGIKAIKDEMKENKKALKQAVEEKENIEKELERLEKKEKEKKVPAKGPKNRNFSQEKIKKVNQLKPEDIKEKFSEDPGSNREAKKEGKAIIRKAHSKDTRAPDSKSTAGKTETSTESKVEDRIPRLGQKEADNASKKSNFRQKEKDFVMEEEEKYREKNKPNNRKTSAENIRSMDDLDEKEDQQQQQQQQPQSKKAVLSYHKQRILMEKEKKRKEEQDRMEKQLQQIRQDNYEALRLANEKRRAQYRPSDDMVSMLNLGPDKKPIGFNGQYNTTSSGFGTVNDRETLNSVESRDNLRALEEGNRSDEKRGQDAPQNFKIQEEYGMDDEIEDDEEEENKIIEEEREEEEEDENLREIREKINKYKDKLKEKTMKINELKQTLKKTMLKEKTMKTSQLPRVDSEEDMKLSPSDNADNDVEDYSDAFDVDEIGEDDDSTEENTNAHESEIQEKKSFHPQYYKIQDRIKLLKYRCEAGIGNTLYEKAYRYLNEKTTAQNQEEIRKHLIDILGEENIGFWHLIDQILLFEGFARKFQEAC